MKDRLPVVVGALGVVAFSGYLLVTGSSLLERTLPGLPSLPAGLPIAWAGLVAFPLAMLAGLSGPYPRKRLRDRMTVFALKTLILLALAWAPLSYWLAGNFRLNFGGHEGFRGSETAFFVFLYYSLALVLLPVVVAIAHGASCVLGGRRRSP
jgi:hypothetical protein